jgi:hypothetical protein
MLGEIRCKFPRHPGFLVDKHSYTIQYLCHRQWQQISHNLSMKSSAPVKQQKAYFTDDFTFSDSMGGPTMDKTARFDMGDLYKASLPDAGFVFDEVHQDADDVIVTGHFTGTFKNGTDLTALNMGIIKATGNVVKAPTSNSRVSFRGDKISDNKDLTTGPNAGLPALLASLKGDG